MKEKNLVIYKNRPALVAGFEGEKINIEVPGGSSIKVREKDIELLHPGPCSLKDLETPMPPGNVRDVWELLVEDACGEEAAGISPKELAELAYGTFSPRTAWSVWELLREGLYFNGDISSLKARPREAVEEDERKLEEKQKAIGDRAAFLEKLKKLPSFKGPENEKIELSETERRFLQDVEALALGQSPKSRTLKELGKAETPEEAHKLLLASCAWTLWENPHPGRFGLDRFSAKIIPAPPPDEARLDLTGLPAFAIDNTWSDDPDDAVSLEVSPEKCVLWVHIADPASSIFPGSPADLEARGRGVTLYLPEGPSRMIAPEALPLFALGFGSPDSAAVSPALSFKITLSDDLDVKEIEIIPSVVKVTRLSYNEADALIAGGDSVLTALLDLAERNVERRLNMGAVLIELPETHISVKLGEENRISIEPVAQCRSTILVRECMVLAGEGAARWALQNRLPFPFIAQEAGELPEKPAPGLAGAWQLRRCMRPRSLSAKPGVHWGLGLDQYTQVTSPLRRYTDLLCHQQIRAFIMGQRPLEEDEVLLRSSAAESAASAANHAERASRAHWTAVYLSGKKNSIWDGVIVDQKAERAVVLIPALGLETQISFRGSEKLNEKIRLRLTSVKIPEAETVFMQDG